MHLSPLTATKRLSRTSFLFFTSFDYTAARVRRRWLALKVSRSLQRQQQHLLGLYNETNTKQLTLFGDHGMRGVKTQRPFPIFGFSGR